MSLIKQSLTYAIGGFLPKVVSFLLLPIISRYLTREDYGIVSAVTGLTALIGMVATLQLSYSGLFRCYYDYAEGGPRRQFVGTIVFSVAFLSLLAIGLCFALHGMLQRLYPTISFYPYYALALVILPLQTLIDTQNILFRMHERPIPFVMVSLLNFFLNLAVTLILVVGYRQGAVGMLWAAIIAQALTIPAALWLGRGYFVPAWSWPMFHNALMYSLQSIPYMVIGVLTVNLDRYLINYYSSTAELGVYGVSEKLASVVGMIGGSVLMAFDPLFFRMAAAEPPEKSKPILGDISTQLIVLFILFGIGGILYSKDAVVLMLDRKFYPAAAVLPWLFATAIVGTVDTIGSAGAKFAKKVIWFAPIYIARGVFVVVLDVLLVPSWGAEGAGMANLVVATAMMVMRYGCSYRYWPVPIAYGRIGTVILNGLLPLVIGLLFPMRSWGWSFALKTLVMIFYVCWLISYMHWFKHVQQGWHILGGVWRRSGL